MWTLWRKLPRLYGYGYCIIDILFSTKVKAYAVFEEYQSRELKRTEGLIIIPMEMR